MNRKRKRVRCVHARFLGRGGKGRAFAAWDGQAKREVVAKEPGPEPERKG
jgi:hypothetical protein